MGKKALLKELAARDRKVRKLKKKLRSQDESAPQSAVSPLAPKAFPELPVIDGIEIATGAAHVKYAGRDDVLLVRVAPGATLAGVFTTSSTRAAPVLDCERKLATFAPGPERAAILVNSGNANAFTGKNGDEAVSALCAAVSASAGIQPDRVFTASTGVIGEPLPHEKIAGILDDLTAGLGKDPLQSGAEAIRTTDTFAKGAGVTLDLGGHSVQIAGIAKGSGMIAPDMATMLSYIFTDAPIAQPVLQKMLTDTTRTTFNAITVDGDTSTSDTVMLAATGRVDMPEIASARTALGRGFVAGLQQVMEDLAKQVVRDGEGATKLVEVTVTGARSQTDARRVAMAIANSPLVKTAIAGEDPNWGRIVMAVGKSGAVADRDRLTIRFGDIVVAENGWVAEGYDESAAAEYMTGAELQIGVDLGIGRGTTRVWTCDLTKRYIEINADYRS